MTQPSNHHALCVGEADTVLMLLDNGSLRPEATRRLRSLAAALQARMGEAVRPVSLLHSNKIDPGQLDGQPAEVLEGSLQRCIAARVRRIGVIPAFFGPSRAITDYLPERLDDWAARVPGARWAIAAPIVPPEAEGDDRIARILADHVRSLWRGAPEAAGGTVVVVDHGSPVEAVTAVRNRVAEQLARLLEGKAAEVVAASMERRPGPEYAFNEPLLASALERIARGGAGGRRRAAVTVAMMFLSPGRHAGPGGDVATICREAESACPALRVWTTPLVGEHPGLIEILVERCREVVAALEDGAAAEAVSAVGRRRGGG